MSTPIPFAISGIYKHIESYLLKLDQVQLALTCKTFHTIANKDRDAKLKDVKFYPRDRLICQQRKLLYKKEEAAPGHETIFCSACSRHFHTVPLNYYEISDHSLDDGGLIFCGLCDAKIVKKTKTQTSRSYITIHKKNVTVKKTKDLPHYPLSLTSNELKKLVRA
jgi:hypothetical protein